MKEQLEQLTQTFVQGIMEMIRSSSIGSLTNASGSENGNDNGKTNHGVGSARPRGLAALPLEARLAAGKKAAATRRRNQAARDRVRKEAGRKAAETRRANGN